MILGIAIGEQLAFQQGGRQSGKDVVNAVEDTLHEMVFAADNDIRRRENGQADLGLFLGSMTDMVNKFGSELKDSGVHLIELIDIRIFIVRKVGQAEDKLSQLFRKF